MITLFDYLNVIDYKITDGDKFMWDCFGDFAHHLDSWNGDQDGYNICCVFSKENQTVFMVEAHDYANERSYRWINPDYKDAWQEELEYRAVDDYAYDTVPFTDLEDAKDFLEKAAAIVRGEDYDTRVSVPLDIPDDELFELMKMAHERDLTLNEFIEDILREAIERHGINVQTV